MEIANKWRCKVAIVGTCKGTESSILFIYTNIKKYALNQTEPTTRKSRFLFFAVLMIHANVGEVMHTCRSMLFWHRATLSTFTNTWSSDVHACVKSGSSPQYEQKIVTIRLKSQRQESRALHHKSV
jgi:hypothetical protein